MTVTVTDLFCGAGGSSLGAEAAGMTLSLAMNHWSTAIEVHQTHFPDAAHDVADISQADPRRYVRTDILLASPECFPAGTLVLTSHGQKPIEQIEVGDQVMTHLGRWRPVVRTQQSKGTLLAVKGQGHWGLEITPNHRLPVRPQNRQWNNAKRDYDRALGETEKVGAAGLSTAGVGRHRWSTPLRHEALSLPPMPTEADVLEFMWLCGRYLADGYADVRPGRGGAVTISLGGAKVERDGPRLEALGFKPRRVRTAWNYDLRDRVLAEWLASYFGHLAHGKQVPAWMHGQPALSEALIAGYVDGDGHVGPRATAASTTSKALAVSMRMLLVEHGFHPIITRTKQHANVIEGRTVNVQPWVFHLRWENNRSQRTGITEAGSAWTLIKSVDDLGDEIVDVFNIEVEEDHTYIAEGIAVCNCTNHSQARGVSRAAQDVSLFDSPDASAERSRATMWDVPRFAEQMMYDAIVVENVVEAVKWVMWPAWWQAMELLGYVGRILSHNSQDHGVAQSRDRIYVVWTRDGLHKHLNLEMERQALCGFCEQTVTVRQTWKNNRTVGRYRQQWIWACVNCGRACEPYKRPAAEIIDWTLDTPRIGDRKRPLSENTRKRIYAGLQRFGWIPVVTAGAGNVFESTPGNRAKPLTEPLPTQQTTATSALAVPPAYLMRNNTGGAEMTTPVTEPARTMTTAGHQSLLLPYYSKSMPRPVTEPIGTQTTRDGYALIDPNKVIDDCGFRMIEPYEAAAAMAFPDGYIPRDLAKSEQMKLAGNAVTPPVMQWICGRIVQALEAA